MFVRNSIKSIIRMPFKSIFYALLITAVTTLLFLGLNTWSASVSMLKDLDKNHTTIVTIEYPESFGSNLGVRSDEELAELAAIDYNLIASNPNVLLWQPGNEGIGNVDGYVSSTLIPEYSYSFVFIVQNLRTFINDTYSPYAGKVTDILYSYRDYENGRNVYVYLDPNDIGFIPDPDKYYVIHATNNRINANGLSVELAPFYSLTAEEAGIDTSSILRIQEIESLEAFYEDENNVYREMADYYAAMSNALTVVQTEDIESLEPFSQNYLSLKSGRLFTQEESQSAANVGIISEYIANELEVEVGDELTVNLPDREGSAFYEWGDGMSNQKTFTIVGILNYHEDYKSHIYLPDDPIEAQPTRYINRLGQATIKNGTSDEFLEALEGILPERSYIAVYDQGYQATANSLIVIRNAAVALSIVALLLTIAVMAFFSYLYTGSQKETVEIKRYFGARKRELRSYLLAGAIVLAIAGITAGILIGMQYAGSIITYTYTLVSDLQATDTRFSDNFRGIVKTFTPISSISVNVILYACGLVMMAMILFCLYFAERTISGRLITARHRTLRSPKRSSVALRGSLRHAVLSLRRGGWRSFIIPALSVVVLLFVASLYSTLLSYDRARDSLYENTSINAYVGQMNGRYTDRLTIKNEQAHELMSLLNADDTMFMYKYNYAYLGVYQHADGQMGEVNEIPWPKDGFEAEVLDNIFKSGPNLNFIDRVQDAPEFRHGELNIEFLEGWDLDRFNQRDWTELPVIVSNQFMEEQRLVLGDTIQIYIERSTDRYDGYLALNLKLVGHFSKMAKQNNIYAPLSLASLKLAGLEAGTAELESGLINDAYLYLDTQENIIRGSDETTIYSMQDLVSDLTWRKTISALSFSVKDPMDLPSIKDELETAGYSAANVAGDIRIAVVIEDSQFNETLSSITQRSSYMEILFKILVVLLAALGLIMGYLIVKSRREDIALMRSIGTRKGQIFATIVGEQIMLVLMGFIPAALLWYILNGISGIYTVNIFVFCVCYIFSVSVATAIQNAKRALAILAEKE